MPVDPELAGLFRWSHVQLPAQVNTVQYKPWPTERLITSSFYILGPSTSEFSFHG
jgi:hypothetical protein